MDATQAVNAQAEQTLFDANLAAMKKAAPHLHTRLCAIQKPNTELMVDENGGVDIVFCGQGLYGRDAVLHVSEQVRGFFDKPTRDWINEPDLEKLVGSTGDYCMRLVRRMADCGIVYDPQLGPEHGHFLIVFGIGLGLHVQALIDRLHPRIVILIEPNLEFLYQSLHVTDWVAIFDRCEEAGTDSTFIVDREPMAIAAKVRQVLCANNPALLDGIGLFTHYPSVVLEQAQDLIRHNLFLALTGLGFLEDELIMSRNALGNLSRRAVEILSNHCSARSEPVFLIGSGPSVDNDLGFIAENSERAVLISIGTGLRTLLEHGIHPNFHVELENGTVNLEIMAALAAKYDVSRITLLASLTVQPGLVALFDRAILFFREKVSSTMLFGTPFSVLQPAGPTVANTALISAIRMGFREIYLFGVDMGSKTVGQFHAKDSVYGAGLLKEHAKPSGNFPGNFGGEVTGVQVFNWSCKVLENVLRAYRDVRVYNCSDGARIAGALPKVTRAIELPDAKVERDGLLESVSEGLLHCKNGFWRELWQHQNCCAQVEEAWDRIEETLVQAATLAEPEIGWIHDLYEILHAEDERNTAVASFLNGTLLISVGCACWYDSRIPDVEHRRVYRRLALEEFQALVGNMKQKLNELFDDIDKLASVD